MAVLRFVFSKKFLIGVAVFIALSIAGIKVWQHQFDRDAEQQWLAMQERWEREVCPLNVDDIYPTVSDEEDFAKHPAVVAYFAQSEKSLDSVYKMRLDGVKAFRLRNAFDLDVQTWFECGKFENEQDAVRHVLTLLDTFKDEVDPIEQALAERSMIGSKHDIELSLDNVGDFYSLDRLNSLRTLHSFFLSRARLNVRIGDADYALADLKRCDQLATFAGREHDIVGFSVYSGLWMAQELMIAEGFQNHIWSEQHLDVLQERRVEWNAYYQKVPVGELFFSVRVQKLAEEHGYESMLLAMNDGQSFDESDSPFYEDLLVKVLFFCSPKNATKYESAISYNWVLDHLYPALQDDIAEADFRKILKPDYGYFNWPDMFATDLYRHGYRLSLILESKVQLSLTATHLERYYLLQGNYPDTLAQIEGFAGDDIIDPITGDTLLYKRSDDGMYELSSVGTLGSDSFIHNIADTEQREPIHFFESKLSE